MKKILFLLFALCPLFYVLQVEAQIDTTKFQVHNYKYHVLMHDGLEMNVVDVSLDWPDSIDGNDCLPLRQYLSRTLGTVGTTADTVIRALATGYGEPVSGLLDTIPDDHRFCYATYQVILRSYKPHTYAVFEVKSTVEPGSLSSRKAAFTSHVVTYDLRQNQLFADISMVRLYFLQSGYVTDGFYDKLFAPLDDDTYSDLQWANIDAAWPDGEKMILRLHCRTSSQDITYDVSVNYEDVRSFVTRKGRKVIEGKLKVR